MKKQALLLGTGGGEPAVPVLFHAVVVTEGDGLGLSLRKAHVQIFHRRSLRSDKASVRFRFHYGLFRRLCQQKIRRHATVPPSRCRLPFFFTEDFSFPTSTNPVASRESSVAGSPSDDLMKNQRNTTLSRDCGATRRLWRLATVWRASARQIPCSS